MKATLTCTALLLGLMAGIVNAGDMDTRLNQLEAKIQAQQNQITQQNAEMARIKGESWMTERRAEEVKSLIREVLSDAETRASLLDSDMQAGWKDHFYLASADGKFLLQVLGQLQVRYTWNTMDDPDRESVVGDDNTDDENVEGFEIRRFKLRFQGHIYDPKLQYVMQINARSQNGDDWYNIGEAEEDHAGDVIVDDAYAKYTFDCGVAIQAGQFIAPFLGEWQVDSSQQIAVERTYLSAYFAVARTQGVQLSYAAEKWQAAVMLHDGSYMANTEHNNDQSDIAVAARGEVLLSGTWDQFKDFRGSTEGDMGAKIGAAIDYESPEEGHTGGTYYEILKWTVDGAVELPQLNGLSLYAAVVGQSLNSNPDGGSADEADQLGWMVQGSVYIIPDKIDVFVRYENIDLDEAVFFPRSGSLYIYQIDDSLGSDEDDISMLTFGFNYYMHNHASKVTVDFTWVLDPVVAELANTGAGIDVSNDVDDDQFIMRLQYQLLF